MRRFLTYNHLFLHRDYIYVFKVYLPLVQGTNPHCNNHILVPMISLQKILGLNYGLLSDTCISRGVWVICAFLFLLLFELCMLAC
jgi:hypothetical protein